MMKTKIMFDNSCKYRYRFNAFIIIDKHIDNLNEKAGKKWAN